MKKLLFLILLNSSYSIKGQNIDSSKSSYFGLGCSLGYRLNNPSISLEYNVKRFVITAQYMLNNFQFDGYSIGTEYALKLPKSSWEPLVGTSYSYYSGGTKIYQKEREPIEKYSRFNITPVSYIIPMVGMRIGLFDFDNKKFKRKHAAFFFVKLGYRFSLNNPASVYSYEEPFPEKLKIIERSISDGIGCSFGGSFLWGNRFKKR